MTDTPSNIMKKHDFLMSFPRLFTRQNQDAFSLIHFAEPNDRGDETFPALEAPDNWSALSTEIFAEQAAHTATPTQTKAIEENTVPSWLWRHVATGKVAAPETSVQGILGRAVGSATYKGWKQDIFADENQARSFYDEACYALAQRFIAIEPKILSSLGLDWAYGLKVESGSKPVTKTASKIALSNKTIDTLVSGTAAARNKWQKLLSAKNADASFAIEFPDVAQEWGDNSQQKMTAVLDLMTFRHNDGSINMNTLSHAIKLLVTLLDLHDAPVGIGFINLAPLLTALAIPYDSDAGRNLAASISAFITAEAYATSAALAGLRGATTEFTQNRETTLRNLRNYRRAAYGDHNDYEKLSVLPVALEIKKAPDLTLVAAAQHRWDEAQELARRHGLRHTHVTALSASPDLAIFMESGAQGITPLQNLTIAISEGDTFHTASSPVITEALSRLGYSQNNITAITGYIAGHKTLACAPFINHKALQARGFDADAIAALENYLPQVNDIRLAFTPWVLGEDFCRKLLKVSASALHASGFNILKQLGFSLTHIAAANAFCYGHGTAEGCTLLKSQHTTILATVANISAEAQIKMAAAVQSFISDAIAIKINAAAGKAETLLLSAWQQGLHSLTVEGIMPPTPTVKKTKRSVSAFIHTQPRPALPARRLTSQASPRLAGIKQAAHKPSSKSKHK